MLQRTKAEVGCGSNRRPKSFPGSKRSLADVNRVERWHQDIAMRDIACNNAARLWLQARYWLRHDASTPAAGVGFDRDRAVRRRAGERGRGCRSLLQEAIHRDMHVARRPTYQEQPVQRFRAGHSCAALRTARCRHPRSVKTQDEQLAASATSRQTRAASDHPSAMRILK
jgi:hypothetical protein